MRRTLENPRVYSEGSAGFSGRSTHDSDEQARESRSAAAESVLYYEPRGHLNSMGRKWFGPELAPMIEHHIP